MTLHVRTEVVPVRRGLAPESFTRMQEGHSPGPRQPLPAEALNRDDVVFRDIGTVPAGPGWLVVRTTSKGGRRALGEIGVASAGKRADIKLTSAQLRALVGLLGQLQVILDAEEQALRPAPASPGARPMMPVHHHRGAP